MQNIIITLSLCHFRNTALKSVLSQIYKDSDILSFTSPEQINRWSEQAEEDVSLAVYIILPDEVDSVCVWHTWYDWLVSPACIAGNKKVSQVTVLYESETLTGLLACACDYYGFQIICIRKLGCDEVQKQIVSHHGGRWNAKRTMSIILTERESMVLGYILRGWSLREISQVLNISMKTVYSFSNNLRQKLVPGPAGLIYAYRETIRGAMRRGLIRLRP
ncbi:helix-turn-helix transcriptional regulator [Citrobacter amalonaticus]|uniref:response regulator transcription factor n=1 Tax=Citrobacter amalonaticus TaxID=35703 RepID=UPI00287AEA63|nr:helix-turn-helix transcriptional regulator [Citrobacter amalonaticus]MDS4036819.1 helix-turn-helix transcriptional regulator [Citrobacter amalonaticus]